MAKKKTNTPAHAGLVRRVLRGSTSLGDFSLKFWMRIGERAIRKMNAK